MAEVKDKALLAQLNSSNEVSDPALLAKLNASSEAPAEARASAPLTKMEILDGIIRAAANGVTFGLADRFAAKMGDWTGLGGTYGDYAGNLKNEQEKTDRFANAYPVGNLAAQTTGAVATLPLLPFGAANVLRASGMGARTLASVRTGAALGALQGAGSSKDWTDLPQTAKDAAFGAGAGATLGAAAPIVGRGVGAVASGIADRLRSTPGISRGAAPHLLDAIKADGPANVRAQLDRLGPDATLADAGPALLGKAQGAALNSDEGRSVLQSALTRRNEGTNSRIMSDVDAALGPAEDPQTVSNAIREYRGRLDERAYPAALDNAPPVRTGPILTQLDAMIDRSVGMERRALENLRDMMMTTERRRVVDAYGHPEFDARGFEKWHDVPVSQDVAEVLHKVKGELDNVIQYDAPGLGLPAGALSRQQGSLKFLRSMLNDALEQQVPGYARANAASEALAKRVDAVQAGAQYLGSGKTTPSPERFAIEFDPLSPGEKIAFAKGSRGNIDRVLGTKANDLQALRSELQGEGGWNTAKLGTVHGQEAADSLIGSVDRNLKFRDTYNKVVENSQTAQRQAAASAMKPTPASETPIVNPNMTLPGLAGAVSKKTLVAIGNAILRRDPTRSYGDVARVLSAQGAQRDAYHEALMATLKSREAGTAVAAKADDASTLAALAAGIDYVRRYQRDQRR